MKLYSRFQVVVFLVFGAVTAAAAGVLLGRYVLPNTAERFVEQAANEDAVTEQSLVITDEKTPASVLPVSAPPAGYTQDESQNISVYEKTNQAVVNITTETVGLNWFLEPIPMEGGSGSGSIIDKNGYVLTNTHVISEASKIFISLADGSQHEAKIVGVDKENDLAVLKFEPPENMELKTISFGNSENLRVGQKVLAIGNPFGFDRTLTVGIVSALGRPIQSDRNIIIKNMIQTDTAINPGNSGGPLLDTQGNMIGINTMIYSTSGSSAGVGFAVPISTARRVVADILTYGRVRRGSIDAEMVQLTSSLASYIKASTSKGLLVSRVKAGSYAEKGGLRGGSKKVRLNFGRGSAIVYLGGDIITAIENQPVATLAEYYTMLEDKKPGETVSITVSRQGKNKTLEIELAEREE